MIWGMVVFSVGESICKDCEKFHLKKRVRSYYKVNQFLLVDLFLIDSIISVARVGRTGAWGIDPVN
jgi:uncharacterized membrane protein